jgi:hypothetical protein
LAILPMLLPSPDDVADDILSTLSRYANAKEVLIAEQEAMEHLHVFLDNQDDDSDTGSMKPDTLPPVSQLKRLVKLYDQGVLA